MRAALEAALGKGEGVVRELLTPERPMPSPMTTA